MFFIEKLMYLKMAEHYLNSLEMEWLASVFVISNDELVLGQELKFVWGSFTNWFHGEAIGPLKELSLMKEENNEFEVLLLISLPRFASHKEV